MTAFLLSVHVLAVILAIGPVAVAASMFPPAVRATESGGAGGGGGSADGDGARGAPVARGLHRITRVYAVIGILVPVFGVATGLALGVLGNAWLVTSMVLTAVAAGILIAVIVPGQRRILADVAAAVSGGVSGEVSRASRRLAMYTGMFNLLWAVVVVLMIWRPGSTTGV